MTSTDIAVSATDHSHPVLAISWDARYGFILSQTPYRSATSNALALSPPVQYGICNLHDVLFSVDGPTNVTDYGHPAFPPTVRLCQKLSVRIAVTGHEPYCRQVTVLRTRGERPTRVHLAVIVAREVQRFLDREKRNQRPLTFCHQELKLDHLFLLEIRHVSRGSIQPVLGVFCF
ncbi:hypothetical protein C8Q80DRAFT_1209730 [Daedaleopsis nitida]|nr:hypothetical protein C8Q80DRAFT_1209730 [Daedaleopsis nitida]